MMMLLTKNCDPVHSVEIGNIPTQIFKLGLVVCEVMPREYGGVLETGGSCHTDNPLVSGEHTILVHFLNRCQRRGRPWLYKQASTTQAALRVQNLLITDRYTDATIFTYSS